ncbi:MAG: YeeE/YedE thiosulfate transporter family protein, partial [Candidatus Rifleibacteriota bacterium]
EENSKNYLNPYLAGFLLGMTLLASFVVLGTGLGASGGLARISAWCGLCVAPDHFLKSTYFGAWGEDPLNYYLVFMFAGVMVGGFFSALVSRRINIEAERGLSFGLYNRLWFALGGGVVAGFASRFARGCTSGQALTGTALMMTGSVVFLICVFAGGYLTAYFFRRQWYD